MPFGMAFMTLPGIAGVICAGILHGMGRCVLHGTLRSTAHGALAGMCRCVGAGTFCCMVACICQFTARRNTATTQQSMSRWTLPGLVAAVAAGRAVAAQFGSSVGERAD